MDFLSFPGKMQELASTLRWILISRWSLCALYEQHPGIQTKVFDILFLVFLYYLMQCYTNQIIG